MKKSQDNLQVQTREFGKLSRGIAPRLMPTFFLRICSMLKWMWLIWSILGFGYRGGVVSSAFGEILFDDATNSSGISYIGGSWGASWGDFNGDGWPDLWSSNHFNRDTLYLNQRDGTFVDRTRKVFCSSPGRFSDGFDTHGGAWADFDNDGDQDLVVMNGGSNGRRGFPNQMYVNEGGKLCDRAAVLGLDYPLGRGRTPIWLDFDNDGRLDLVQTGPAPRLPGGEPQVFHQLGGRFEEARLSTGFDNVGSQGGFLSDLSGDGRMELIILGKISATRNPIGMVVYDINGGRFQNVTAAMFKDDICFPKGCVPVDVVSADFNGDLLPDLYMTRNGITSEVIRGNNKISAYLNLLKGEERGVQFDTDGDVLFRVAWRPPPIRNADIYIGSSGWHPEGTITGESSTKMIHFPLFPNTMDNLSGIFPHVPGVDRGIYISYDYAIGRWTMLVSSPEAEEARYMQFLAKSTAEISRPRAIGFDPHKQPLNDILLLNTGREFVKASEVAGIAGESVVAADFDNDMDVDLYIVATGLARNRKNVLLENRGAGSFFPVPNAGGAAGTRSGVGDVVVTADYDMDGFIDLFVANTGSNERRTTLIYPRGPYQLFHNRGNANHWLEIDLEGVSSNRDGIGAIILVEAGGVTQLREAAGGMHRWAQNHRRIHFGLGANPRVTKLEIRWPSGKVQTLRDIVADQVLRVIEPSNPVGVGQACVDFLRSFLMQKTDKTLWTPASKWPKMSGLP